MCNPRRVRVTATQQLAEAWEHEVTRVVTLTADVVGVASMRERLDESIGAPTLVMLESVLSQAEGWQEFGDSFRHGLDGGYIAYHPETGELEIVAQLSDTVSAAGSASHLVGGELHETIEVTGTGTYYDDNWGGITEQDAHTEAERDAQQLLSLRRQEIIDAARDDQAGRLTDELDAEASERARLELQRTAAQRHEQLREQARARLIALGVQGRNLFHIALAEAYREAILAYARSRGAQGLVCQQNDGVLEIEFELRG
jgi:hypothetical protein